MSNHPIKPKHRALYILAGVVLFIVTAIWFRSRQVQSIVLTDPIKKGSILESVYGIGTVTATHSFQLKPGVTTNILKLYVREGDQVKKGARLVELSDMTPVSAPFDGTITFLPSKEGETVAPQSVVLSLVDLRNPYLIVSLEQRAALRVLQGQKAKINFDSMRDQSFDGVVQAIYSNENNFFVRIGVEKLPNQILPGMTGDVAIEIREHQNVLLIPIAAIESGKVFVDKGRGTSRKVEIQTGIVDATMAELTSGNVAEGDRLVIRKKITP